MFEETSHVAIISRGKRSEGFIYNEAVAKREPKLQLTKLLKTDSPSIAVKMHEKQMQDMTAKLAKVGLTYMATLIVCYCVTSN